MKGVVFVELLAMAESLVGEDAVDDVIDGLDLASGGSYTSVGIYPCGELMTIVEAFSKALDAPVDTLQRQFGHWMFGRFIEGYPVFFTGKTDAPMMLESIENEVHVEVRKLYPDVELPSFETQRLSDGGIIMGYRSDRPLIDFCHGMIEACVEHFETPMSIEVKTVSIANKFAADFLVRNVA